MSVRNSCPLLPGRAYRFTYPRHNFQGIPISLETRRLVVAFVRDLKADPLAPETVPLNPTLKRGRYLVVGQDLDKGEERRFYAESMESVEPIEPVEPLAQSDFCVVEQQRITFRAKRVSEAIAYMLGSGRGVLCAVMHSREKTRVV